MRTPILAAALFLTATAASAQAGRSLGREHPVRDACAADIKTYCADVKPGGGRYGQCFKAHASDLSAPCKDAIAKRRAERKAEGAPAPK